MPDALALLLGLVGILWIVLVTVILFQQSRKNRLSIEWLESRLGEMDRQPTAPPSPPPVRRR